MRRFEFSEGASNKFWEIERDGSDLVIRWGRIGTQGQSQTKNFADAAKATSALDKLVSEKTGKGYVEAAAGGAAMPAAAANDANAVKDKKKNSASAVPVPAPAAALDAAPAVTAAAPSVTAPGTEAAIAVVLDELPPLPSLDGATPPWLAAGEPLDFDAAMKRLLQAGYEGTATQPLPSRRFPGSVHGSDVRAAWGLAKKAILQDKELDLAASDAALQTLLRETWVRLEKDQLQGSDESQALLLALACALIPHSTEGSIARHLVERRGLPGALELLVRAHAYSVTVENDWKGGRGSVHKLSVTQQVSGVASKHWGNPLSTEEQHFRRSIAQAPEGLWQQCADLIEAALPTLHPARQVTLALLLPDAPELSNQLALQLAGPATPDALHWLQLTATDPAALTAIQAAKISYGYFFHNGALLATVLQERRLDALRLFVAEPALDNMGDVLTYFGVPEAIDALARVAGSSKSCLQRLNVASQRWPLAAIPALAHIIAAGGREAGPFMPVLSSLLQNHGPALPALRPWLEAPAAAVIDRLLAQLTGPAEVADVADLPRVLADPPWLKPRKTLASISALVPLPLPTQVHWPEGERERAAALSQWEQQRYGKFGKDLLAFVEELGFSRAYRAVDEKLEFVLRDEAAKALRSRDMDALHSAWTRMKANRKYLYLTVDGGLIGQLPDGIAIEVWNRLAGDGTTDSHVTYMLARFGLDVWPGVLRAIRRTPSTFADLALKCADVELAASAARALVKLKTLRQFGRDWLLRHPEHAAAGLIAPALGKPGEARDCAGAALRFLAANGHEALILDVARRYGRDDVDAAVRLMLDEDPLDRFPSRRGNLPAFWAPRGWRRPLLRSNGKALPDAAIDHLGSMLAFPANDELYPGIAKVVAACTPESLGDFAWDLFNAWLAAAAPSKDGWGMAALGWLGNDDTARRLTPLIRNWPGEGAHARAVLGLDVLAAIGSDVALMLLNGIAQKVKFKGLQDKAREKIDAIAEARSLGTEELEDRLAPDLGLDEAGTLLLDFGPRQFRVGFDEALKPYVRDSDGARLADLPKPKKTDDASLAAAAVERFKLLKKDARTIASQQVLRLEIAMCTRRRWDQTVFERFLAGHPLLRHLVQRLVWGVYEMDADEQRQGGRLLQCFRVAEDGSYSDADDAPLSLPQGDRIRLGLPHALELPAQTAAAFGQLFADYELMQPFQQLGRESFALSDEERATLNLERWKGKVVPAGRVLGLANKGWRRGAAQDGGGIWYFTKPLVGDLAIELNFEPGIIVGLVEEYPQQTLLQLQVGRPSAWGDMQDTKPFATLDPIAASELIRDMQSLCA